MQAIWKGTISFGMVTIPVKVYSATDEKDISFRQVHTADGGRIRYKRVCEVDGEEVPYSDIGKGYELSDGRVIVLSSEDFADLPLPTKKAVEVLEFIPLDEVDPVYFAKAYYLAAEGVGAKPYVLLRDALVNAGQAALVKVAIRTRETLALLRPKDGVLVLQTMLWPDEVRDASFAEPADDIDVRPQEIAMAESYIETLQAEFDPSRYHSEYREALERLIEAKTAGEPVPEADEPEDTGGAQVVDLVAALQASVEEAKRRRAAAGGGSSSGASGAAKSGSATKSGAAKFAASRAASGGAAAKASTGKSASDAASKSAGSKRAAKKSSSTRNAAKKSASKTSPARKSA